MGGGGVGGVIGLSAGGGSWVAAYRRFAHRGVWGGWSARQTQSGKRLRVAIVRCRKVSAGAYAAASGNELLPWH